MIALYCRVSTQEQAENGYSIDEQAERTTKYCDAMGWRNFKVYTDAGFSGGNTDRPALQQLIKDVKDGKIEKVVVYKLDRLSRNQLDTLYLIEKIFLAHGCDFISMSENFDTSSPFGRAMLGILAVFAQLEREQIKERMLMGREARAKSGLYHGGGKSPIGYEYKDGNLIVVDFEAMQIRELFRMYTHGASMGEIQRDFIARGFTHQHGAWSIDAIRRTIQNQLYVGMVEFGGKYYEGRHEPIIDKKTFDAANARLNARRNAHVALFGDKRARSTYLGGLIYCARCGAKYGVWAAHAGVKYYSCYSRHKSNKKLVVDPNCKNDNYRMEKLDEIVLGEIKKLAVDPDAIRKIQASGRGVSNADQIKTIKAEIGKVEKRRARLLDLYTSGTFDASELDEQVKPLNEKLAALKNQLEIAETDASSNKKAASMIKSFAGIIKRGEYSEIRFMIESLIDRVVIDGQDVTIYWAFD